MDGQIFNKNKQNYQGMWMGEVVNVADPLKNGRVQVWLFGLFDGINTADLPWARPIMPSIGGSDGSHRIDKKEQNTNDDLNVGQFTVPNLGSHVMCMIPHNDPNMVFYMGICPSFRAIGNTKTAQWNERLREAGGWSVDDTKKSKKITDQADAASTWSEPDDTWPAAKYPARKSLISSETGISIETDDTPGNETIMVFHPTGSYVELQPNGDVIIHATNDEYNLIAKNKYETVKENKGEHIHKSLYRTTSENEKIHVEENRIENIDANETRQVGGSVKEDIGGVLKIMVQGSINIETNGKTYIGNPGGKGGVCTTLHRCMYTGSPHPGSSSVFASK